jgi:hypothetical protein
VRGERHAGPEAVRVGAPGEAQPLEVLNGGVLGEDPPQRLPLDGGGIRVTCSNSAITRSQSNSAFFFTSILPHLFSEPLLVGPQSREFLIYFTIFFTTF